MLRFRAALLAAAAIAVGIPAIASAQREGLHPDGEQRGERGPDGPRGDRGQQRQFGGQPDRPQPPQAAPAPPAPGRPDGAGFDRADRGQRFGGADQRGDRGQPAFAGRDDRGRGGGPGGDQRQGYDPRRDRDQRGFDDGRRGDPRPGFADGRDRGGDSRFAYDRGRDDRGSGFRGAPGPQGRFGPEWRNDRRYDWQGYRNQHRDIFRAGRYQPPRGYYSYGYRPFQIGVRLDPYFYASNYWIDDPYDYRLPPVWGSYRWVRYYDDVLLVDLSSGQIVDVIRQFFW